MKMMKVKLAKQDEWIEIKIIPEQQYLKLIELSFVPENIKKDINLHDYRFQYRIVYNNDSDKSGTIVTGIHNQHNPCVIEQELDVLNSKKIYIKYTYTGERISESDIFIKYEILKKLDITNPLLQFDNHLNKFQNPKILFSAPFGQGKTTFLDFYFKEKSSEYEVFKVFPVNYSVASNEDVFRYIKADILYQLIVNKDIEFDNVEEQFGNTVPKFVIENIDKILAPLLMLIPKVGKRLYSIYEKYDALKHMYFKYSAELVVNDINKANQFLQSIIEEEGSIYEDNVITQIIRHQINKIQTTKKTVLIIDDLDRMDPEHTFRILNVISAHYDTNRDDEYSLSNKFDFDKIILVSDYDNIKYMFEHRYGKKVNFSGYINKYYSTEPFNYNNKQMMFKIISELDDVLNRWGDRRTFLNLALQITFRTLIISNKITLRDVIKLKNFSLKSIITDFRNHYATVTGQHSAYSLFFPIFELLSKIWSEETLLVNLEECKGNNLNLRINQNTIFWYLIVVLGKENGSSGYYYKSTNYEFKYTIVLDDDYDFSRINNIKINNGSGEEINIDSISFDSADFHYLLIENAKKYFQLKKS